MAKFRKKPVVIDAWLIKDLLDTEGSDLPDVIRAAHRCNDIEISYNNVNGYHYVVNTLEGQMVGDPTDYLICGISGEFYPCKPDIFEQSYEKVDSL